MYSFVSIQTYVIVDECEREQMPQRDRQRASASADPFNAQAIDLSDMKAFLTSPCPKKAGIVQCYIR